MLGAYYTLMLILTGSENQRLFGPYPRRAGNESALIKAWLGSGSTSAPNRGIWAIGDGFVEANTNETEGNGEQQDLLANYFGVGLASGSYASLTGNLETPVDLKVFPDWQGKKTGTIEYYGIRNQCVWSNDVLELDGIGITLGAVTSHYAATTGGEEEIAGVFKRWDPSSPWMAQVDGWNIEHLTSRFDANTVGRSGYFHKLFTNVWAQICGVAGTPVVPLDVPQLGDAVPVDFVALKNNPVRRGHAVIELGLARADRVAIRIYDVGGRLVRTLANRNFAAGRHDVVWDGLDDHGRRAARGIYFSRVHYRSSPLTAVKKVTVLR
jgi:hypothetical protein